MISCTFQSFLNLQYVNWGLHCHRLEVLRGRTAFHSKCKRTTLIYSTLFCIRTKTLHYLLFIVWLPWCIWKSQLPMAECLLACLQRLSFCILLCLNLEGTRSSLPRPVQLPSFVCLLSQIWKKALFLGASFIHFIFWLFTRWLFCFQTNVFGQILQVMLFPYKNISSIAK